MQPWIDIPGDPESDILLIADHASNQVPDGISLGVPLSCMEDHVAIDIGVAALAAALCDQLACPAILGGVTRLVIDLNREDDSPGLIPEASDGIIVPANAGLGSAEREDRIARFWRPYHHHIEEHISKSNPKLLISLHSFTPQLATSAVMRPWEIGILYNEDDRAARIALPLLEQDATVAGDNLPYSGKVLNATMNRHGEANGIPYLGIEVRQDLIAGEAGVAVWCERLVPIIKAVRQGLTQRG